MNFCENCSFTVTSFLRMKGEELFDFLLEHGVLIGSKRCPKCECECRVYGHYFTCRKTRTIRKNKKKKKVCCDFRETIYKNTFFFKTHLTIDAICRFVVFFITTNEPKTIFLQQELGFTGNTLLDWTMYIHEVLMEWAIRNSEHVIGGKGIIVELDEVKMPRRRLSGSYVEGQFAYGAFERESKKMFVIPVPDNSQETLLEIIKQKIAPESTIFTDCWQGDESLKKHGYHHINAHHGERSTEARIQCIERQWRIIRSKRARNVRVPEQYEAYIAEFFFLRKYQTMGERIHHIFKAIADFYCPQHDETQLSMLNILCPLLVWFIKIVIVDTYVLTVAGGILAYRGTYYLQKLLMVLNSGFE